MEKVLLCSDSTPSFLRLFDLSIAPPLLFYSYIPVIIISILLGLYVLKKDNYSLPSKLLFLVELFFSLWVFDIFIMWIAAYNSSVMFAWQMNSVFEVPIFILSVYFVYIFVSENRQDISNKIKLWFIALASPFVILLSTKLNIVAYDLTSCEGINGYLWDYMYVMELVCIFWVLNIGLKKIRESQVTPEKKKEVIYLTIGVVSFLVLFMVSNFIGEITGVQEISFIGSFGMVLFLGLLTYMIVKYQAFNIKLLGAQALVWSLIILIGSQFFFIQNQINMILTGATLLVTVVLGYYLILGVKKEIELSQNLAIANKGQENLIHIMNHQIKGYIGVAKNIFAELWEGTTYGKMPDKAQPLLAMGLKKMNDGVQYIQGILMGESAQSGKLPFNMSSMDLKPLIENLLVEQKPIAEEKGLSLESKIKDGDYSITGDAMQLGEAFKNLVTNAIKYTEKGSLTVTMSRSGQKILWAVKDTGLGITKEDQERLFKPGGMGKDSQKYNVESSGYGLAFAKPVIETHKGSIRYETEVGKGTTFFVELPVK